MEKPSQLEAIEMLGKVALLLDEAMENIERNGYLSQCSDELRHWTEHRRQSLIKLLQEGLDSGVSEQSFEETIAAARKRIQAAKNATCPECSDT